MSTKHPLQAALHTSNIWLVVLWGTIIFFCQPSLSSSTQSPRAPHASGSSHSLHLSEGVAQQVGLTVFGWEGSAEGKAYSEFNHRLAGAVVVLIGLSELHGALGITAWLWMRLLLPGAMLAAGTYLIVWSDHAAWPIGSQTFMDTFVGGDTETLQHKSYALLLLVVGMLELFRRSGRLQEGYWALSLPAFAVIGGSLLFLHSHGDHPSAHTITLHHLTMGGDGFDGWIVPDDFRVWAGHKEGNVLYWPASCRMETRLGNSRPNHRRSVAGVC
jgi:putative copper resistance protein D